MMRSISMMCAVALTCAAVVTEAQSVTADKSALNQEKGGTIMATGCVSERAGNQFILMSATSPHDMKAPTTSEMTAPMTGAMKDPMKPMSYALMGGNLKVHVGHRVEVTGTMAPAKVTDATVAPTVAPTVVATDKMAGDIHGTITVTAVKMIAATCA